MKKIVRHIGISILLTASIALLMIAFGGPSAVPAMASINEPFKDKDFSGVPAAKTFKARDGALLAYRLYPTATQPRQGSIVLTHGSSANGRSLHFLAMAFAQAGFDAYPLDIRGHGQSAEKGLIDYVGQLEDDLEDFSKAINPAQPSTLAGFSSGGGFALRFAGSDRQDLFANYLLLSPFINQDSPTQKPNSGGWVDVGVPRIIGLVIINGVGIKALNHLPVMNFALGEDAKSNARADLTPSYSFALGQNYRPLSDYQANIQAVRQPMSVVAGTDDEAFHTDKFKDVFASAGQDVPVTLVPSLGHIPLTLEAVGLNAAVAAVLQMNQAAPKK